MYPPIEEQDAGQIAKTFIEVISRIGQLGREAGEAVGAALKEANRDPDVEEGLAQVVDYV